MVETQNNDTLEKATLNIPPDELVRWIKEEIREKHIHLNFYNSAWKEYTFDEDFDHAAYGVEKEEDVHLVSVKAVLDVEPLQEQNYWLLQLIVRNEIGLRHSNEGLHHSNEEEKYVPGNLTVDDFENDFLKTGEGDAEIILFTETEQAKKNFKEWFSILKSEHPKQ